MIRVILADDHELVRSGLRRLLDGTNNIVVVDDVADGQDLCLRVAELKPDVALVDMSMPKLNGIEATARITRDTPETRVLIVSMHATEVFVRRAVEAGAKGFVSKTAAGAELASAVGRIAAGDTYFDSTVAEFAARARSDHAGQRPQLTHRELEVLQLIVEGYTSKAIGEVLNISPRTVDTHRRNIMNSLEIGDLPGLVRYAVRQGIIAP